MGSHRYNHSYHTHTLTSLTPLTSTVLFLLFSWFNIESGDNIRRAIPIPQQQQYKDLNLAVRMPLDTFLP